VFGSGINLTHLYHGRIDFLFYLVRDLGYVHKIYRGVLDGGGESREKLWVASVELDAAAVRRGRAADEMDRAIERRVDALTSSGLVNAAANRRALRAGQEPLDLSREYMATYAREQAHCHLSPALVSNLEQHWNAHRRTI
jgi:(3,5-dihydroxyphenyl)acetyl-CoA 1,2-dioxygenase